MKDEFFVGMEEEEEEEEGGGRRKEGILNGEKEWKQITW